MIRTFKFKKGVEQHVFAKKKNWGGEQILGRWLSLYSAYHVGSTFGFPVPMRKQSQTLGSGEEEMGGIPGVCWLTSLVNP